MAAGAAGCAAGAKANNHRKHYKNKENNAKAFNTRHTFALLFFRLDCIWLDYSRRKMIWPFYLVDITGLVGVLNWLSAGAVRQLAGLTDNDWPAAKLAIHFYLLSFFQIIITLHANIPLKSSHIMDQPFFIFTTLSSVVRNELVNQVGVLASNLFRLGHTPTTVNALWDTGATHSAITPQLARKIGLPIIDRM